MTTLVDGTAEGECLVLTESISFWGGVDPETGRIIDPGHAQFGESLAARIVVLPRARGSSSSSSVLAEALRRGVGPAGIVLGEPDSILMIGSLVAQLLYGLECPILVERGAVTDGHRYRIENGRLTPVASTVEKSRRDADN